MNYVELIGFGLTLVMGMVLGLVGAGGSILTVPILVYFFGLAASRATGASLAIVGGVALVGAVLAWRKGDLDFRAVLLFGIPSVAVAFTIRRWGVPAIPDLVYGLSKDTLLLILFAVAMVIAAYAMLKRREPARVDVKHPSQWIIGGLGAGTVTGLLGAGGGFVIVPALTAGMGLPMRQAIGSSMAIISLNSAAGLVAEVQAQPAVDWSLVAQVGAVALVGLAVGSALQSRVSSTKLKVGFGRLIIVVAAVIIIREMFHI